MAGGEEKEYKEVKLKMTNWNTLQEKREKNQKA